MVTRKPCPELRGQQEGQSGEGTWDKPWAQGRKPWRRGLEQWRLLLGVVIFSVI